MTLQFTDLGGTPLTELQVGDQFLVKAYVRDARSNPTGVFQAYLDVNFDANLVTLPADTSLHHGEYGAFVSGTVLASGLIDEVGGLDFDQVAPSPKGRDCLLFATNQPWTAANPGTLTFTATAADSPLHWVEFFVDHLTVPADEINFQSSIQILSGGIRVTPTSGLTTTEGGGTAAFDVVLTKQPTADVTIGLSSGDLTEGTVMPASLTFTPTDWNSAQHATITGVNDDVIDGPVGYTIVTAPAVSTDSTYSGKNADDVSVTNTDDDATTVSIAATDPNGSEPGTDDGLFTVTLAGGKRSPAAGIQVNYTIAGNATAGTDYATLSGTVIIASGDSSATISLDVLNDQVLEPAEAVTLTLTGTNHASVTVGTPNAASVNIADDDVATVGITNQNDGAEATTPTSGKFRVTLTKASSTATVIAYSVNGTATPGAGNDYTALSGTVTIPAGATAADIDVSVLNDTIVEGSETVILMLTGISSGDADITIDAASSSATVSLGDDDTAAVSLARVSDGAEAATPTNGKFRVTQSKVAAVDTVLSYTLGGTATGGAGGDYTPLAGSVTIPAGIDSADIDVAVLNDDLVEATETVTITLGSVTSAAFGVTINNASKTATISITDDDAATVRIANANDAAEAATPTDGKFRVTQTKASSTDTVLSYTVTGTATPGVGNDYTPLSGTVTIPAGMTTTDIDVAVLNDNLVESNETVTVTLASITSGDPQITIENANKTATVSIADDDTALVSISKANDGAEAVSPTNGKFRVTQTKASATATVLSYTVNGSATPGAGNDYTALSGTVTIAAGATTADFDVTVRNDNVVEGPETVIVTLGSITNGDPDVSVDTANSSATVTIADEDMATVALTKISDGAEAATPSNGRFRVTQTKVIAADTVLSYTVNGTATPGAGNDYTALSGTATIPAGATSSDIDVLVLNDNVVEATETVIVTLSGVVSSSPGVSLGTASLTATVSIADEDTATVSITKIADGAEAETPVAGEFRVTQTKASSADTVVSYSVNGTATPGAGNDYTPLAGTVTIPAGATSADIDVTVVDDNLVEGAETVTVTLTNITNGDPQVTVDNANKTATASLADDDTALVSIAAENDGAEAAVPVAGKFRLTQTKPAAANTVVSYTINGTATPGAGKDYQALSGSVTILAGATTADIDVPVLDDTLVEGAETVVVTLDSVISSVAGISLDNAARTATISIGDDDTAKVSIAGINDGAEAASPTSGKFRLTQSQASATDTVLSYTVHGTATPGAGNDYTALGGAVTISAGATTVDIDVLVLNDNLVEDTETVIVTLGSITSASPGISVDDGAKSATVSIADDDSATITIAKINDGAEAATPTNGKFRLTQTKASSTDTVVSYTVNGTATPGAGNDYTPLGGTVTISAGATTADIDVLVLNDNLVEAAETVIVTLDSITSGDPQISLGATTSATVAISSEDAATVSLEPPTPVEEGDSGLKTRQFTVTLSAPVDVPVTVNYQTADGTAQDEHGNRDYQSASDIVTFSPGGDLTKTITVDVYGDTVVEPDETFQVVLSNLVAGTPARAVTLGVSQATGTIVDDDAARLTIAATLTAEEDATHGALTITTNKRLSQPVTVFLSVSGTAKADADYAAIGSSVTFPALTDSFTIPVTVLSDEVIEGDETVVVQLASTSDPAARPGTPDTATLTIADNDTATVSIIASDATGGEPGTDDGQFTIALDHGQAPPGGLEVNFTVNGTATAGADYAAIGNSVTIPAGESAVAISVDVQDDTVVELSESVIVTLTGTNNLGATIDPESNTATVTVADDDTGIVVITRVNDGAEAAAPTPGKFRVTQTQLSSTDTVLSYSVTGTATPGTGHDYTPLGGTVTIAAGATSADIDVAVLDDNVVEATETAIVTLDGIASAAPGITIADAAKTATISIADDDTAEVSITKISDGVEIPTPVAGRFRVTQSQPSSTDTLLSYTVGGTATPGAANDYEPLSGTLTIAAGTTSSDIEVTVLDDLLLEGDETVIVTLSGITSGDPQIEIDETNRTATVIITDEETSEVSIAKLHDAAEAPVPVAGKFQVSQTLVSSTDTVLSYTVTGTATPGAGHDYMPLAGTVTIAAGATTADIDVTVLDDDLVEGGETIIVTLTAITSGHPELAIDALHAAETLAVSDDDAASVSIDKIADGAEAGLTPGKFRVSQSQASSTDTVLNYAVTGTATPGAGHDYTQLSGTVTIPAGSLTADIDVAVLDDELVEATETVSLTLTSVASGAPQISINQAGRTAVLDILNDDSATVSIAWINDGAEGATPTDGRFRVTQTMASDTDTVLSYAVAGTATPGSGNDYLPLSGNVTIAAGSTTADIVVSVLNDVLIEAAETVVVTLAAVTSVAPDVTIDLTNRTATVSILDEPTTVSISASDPVGSESGADAGEFTVNLAAGWQAPLGGIQLSYTVSGDATSEADYTALSGVVIISAGQSSVTISVEVLNDNVVELPETVTLTLTGTDHASVAVDPAANEASVTINDDDPTTVSIAASDASGSEPGTDDGQFTVALDGGKVAPTGGIVVTYTVSGAATAGVDYTALAGTVTILAGQSSATIPVDVLDDDVIEALETVVVTLTGTSHAGATISATDVSATVMIDSSEDNATVSISATDATGREPGTDDAQFTVTLSGGKVAPTGGIAVSYSIGGGATAGSDYTTLPGTVTIPAGASSATIAVDVLDDNVVESAETVIVTLTGTNNAGATVGTTNNAATATIQDDDPTTVSISASDANTAEPSDSGQFTVTLNNGKVAPPDGITVSYTSAGTATAGSDFTAPTGTATIPAGASSTTIQVAVLDDNVVEVPETVIVTLTGTNNPGVTVASANQAATVTITDNDPTTVSIAASDGNGSEPGTDDGLLTVTLDGGKVAPSGGIAVTYTVAGTATAGTDYTTLSGTVTILAGQSSTPIPVDVLDDNVVEAAETVAVTLTGTNHSGATIHATNEAATVTIDSADDNTTVSITASDATGREPGTDDAQFTVTLANSKVAPAGGIVVSYTTGGTATAGSDYTALPGTVTIPAGAASTTIAVDVLDDTVVESSETVIVTLTGTNHAGATIAAANNAATATIEDDDPTTVTISASDANAGEPSDNGQFTVTLQGGKVAPTGGIAVSYTAAGTATAGSDYTALSGSVTILAGESSATIPVSVIADSTADEPEETVVVTLTSTSHPSVTLDTANSATVKIAADDLRNASISGVVWVDADNDRQQDEDTAGNPSEPGIPGVIVKLTGTARDGTALNLQAMTADDGSYRFFNLPAGTYDVSEEQPAAWIDGQEMLTSSTTNDTYSNIVLTPSQQAVDYSFGERTLQPQFVSKRQFLASTPVMEVYLREVNALAKQHAGDTTGAQAIRDASIPSEVSAGPTASTQQAQNTAEGEAWGAAAGTASLAAGEPIVAAAKTTALGAEGEATVSRVAVTTTPVREVPRRLDVLPAKAAAETSSSGYVAQPTPQAAPTTASVSSPFKVASSNASLSLGAASFPATTDTTPFESTETADVTTNGASTELSRDEETGPASLASQAAAGGVTVQTRSSSDRGTSDHETEDNLETAARVDMVFAEDAWLDDR